MRVRQEPALQKSITFLFTCLVHGKKQLAIPLINFCFAAFYLLNLARLFHRIDFF